MIEDKNKSCWTCEYQNINVATFLGVCEWFQRNNKGENKDIPVEVVDKGCKHWKTK